MGIDVVKGNFASCVITSYSIHYTKLYELWGIIFAAAVALLVRIPLKVDIIRDRAAIAREVEGGLIENIYRIQLMNTQEVPRRFLRNNFV